MIELEQNRRGRILIVDDQPANIQVMAEALKGTDYELFFATTSEKALAIVRESSIDLVLLDVVMPGTNGFEICRRIKADERTKDIAVIFVTAREETEDETHGFDVGGVDYIAKPIRPPIVRARVKTHLELKEARDLLEKMASLDKLTGIANRRRFDHVIALEWTRALRSGRSISLAIIDIDHFKKYNDTYGHSQGDACLRSVAQAMKDVVGRPGDLIARYGGEEFALVLPDVDEPGLQRVMQNILDRVALLRIAHSASTAGPIVSISMGAVSVVPQAENAFGAAIESADKLLYEAKSNGRSRCVFQMAGGAPRTLTVEVKEVPS